MVRLHLAQQATATHDKFGVPWLAYQYSELGQERVGFSFVDSQTVRFLVPVIATAAYPFIWLFNQVVNGMLWLARLKPVLTRPSNWKVRRCEILEPPPKWEIWLEGVLGRILYPMVFVFCYSIVVLDCCIRFVNWIKNVGD